MGCDCIVIVHKSKCGKDATFLCHKCGDQLCYACAKKHHAHEAECVRIKK